MGSAGSNLIKAKVTHYKAICPTSGLNEILGT